MFRTRSHMFLLYGLLVVVVLACSQADTPLENNTVYKTDAKQMALLFKETCIAYEGNVDRIKNHAEGAGYTALTQTQKGALRRGQKVGTETAWYVDGRKSVIIVSEKPAWDFTDPQSGKQITTHDSIGCGLVFYDADHDILFNEVQSLQLGDQTFGDHEFIAREISFPKMGPTKHISYGIPLEGKSKQLAVANVASQLKPFSGQASLRHELDINFPIMKEE